MFEQKEAEEAKGEFEESALDGNPSQISRTAALGKNRDTQEWHCMLRALWGYIVDSSSLNMWCFASQGTTTNRSD